MPLQKGALHDLHMLLALTRNQREAKILLEDLLTPHERKVLAERWQLIKALAQGMPQRDIKKKFKISISKITRGSHALRYGSGGFELFLKRMGKWKGKIMR